MTHLQKLACANGREMESSLFRDAFAHAAMRRRCAEELRRLSAEVVLVDRRPPGSARIKPTAKRAVL